MKPEDKIKLYTKIFNTSFIVLLIVFLALYLSQATGYYNYEQHKKMVLTEERIKEFEKDIKAGKDLNLENYLDNPTKNYQNKISGFGQRLSYNIGKYTKIGIKKTFGFLNKILEEN
ncbi:MAG: hypothetical protein PHW32_00145 [Bacilli bacterium]|nr:hypothetical protein [Bacilli bacterium]MDD4282274.1 hypothetical protein [Bacilli bacterium]MDD4718420.1 hypothetical protein [Bacilli bacterium]